MHLPTLNRLDVKNKRVLLRLDLDVSINKARVQEDYRLRASIPTFKYLIEHGAKKIVVLGHRGRPEGKIVESLSLGQIGKYLEKLLVKELGKEKVENTDVFMMENLRFDPRESFDPAQDKEANEFAGELAKEGDVYINDAFGASHRNSASIVLLPRFLPHAAGLRLQEEVEVLSKILDPSTGPSATSSEPSGSGPKGPVVFIIGGGKMEKVVLAEKLLDHAEFVLVGGVLSKKLKSYCREKDGRMCVVAARLTHRGEDITPDSARNFAEIIKSAGTVVWNGPMGDIDSGFWDGTRLIGEAVAQSSAFKVVGGGDTIRALQTMRLLEKIDWISTGGGAMLEFLAHGDLPGLEALRESGKS